MNEQINEKNVYKLIRNIEPKKCYFIAILLFFTDTGVPIT